MHQSGSVKLNLFQELCVLLSNQFIAYFHQFLGRVHISSVWIRCFHRPSSISTLPIAVEYAAMAEVTTGMVGGIVREQAIEQ